MNFRQRLIAIATFLGGIYFFLEFVLPEKLPEVLGGFEFGKYHNEVSNGFIAVGAVAFALGLINLLYVHGSKIVFGRKGALNSAALLLSLFAMMYLTLNEWITSEKFNAAAGELRDLAAFSRQIKTDAESKRLLEIPTADRIKILITSLDSKITEVQVTLDNAPKDTPAIVSDEATAALAATNIEVANIKSALENDTTFADLPVLEKLAASLITLASGRQKIDALNYKVSLGKAAYDFVYEGLFIPLGSAMFALLGFYIISAGYRAFRVKSAESALMMIAAVIVMLGQIPFYSYISEDLPEMRLWLLQVPSAAAFRAIKFGAAVAGLYMAIRMWFSIESVSFGNDSAGKTGGSE